MFYYYNFNSDDFNPQLPKSCNLTALVVIAREKKEIPLIVPPCNCPRKEDVGALYRKTLSPPHDARHYAF